MQESSAEDRFALRSAMTSTAMVSLPQPKVVDVYEREANALVVRGLSRDEVITRVIRRMGLSLDDQSTDDEVIFNIEHSQKHRALYIQISAHRVSGHVLVPLDTLVDDDKA